MDRCPEMKGFYLIVNDSRSIHCIKITTDPYKEEDEIPSDLSINHHPHRTCEYNLAFANLDGEEEESADEFESTSDESKWMVDDTYISDLCSALKNVTLELAKRSDPVKLSDIRLLLLIYIYKFDRNFTSSVSKYFSSKVHTSPKPILSFDVYLPIKGLNCYDWCMEIEVSPPVDWISSITLCAELLTKACQSKNLLDIHTAHILTRILPALINGPLDDSNEDSYVHYYLSPLLSSVFASDPLLKMKWANSQLIKNNRNEPKLDFVVLNLSGSVGCVILIAEFKPTEQNSYVESDLVKLAKQMKEILKVLVVKGVKKPKVCGIHCEGEDVQTYVMGVVFEYDSFKNK